ncbi:MULTISPECIES: sensor histidine kinase [Streptomycetaceae]|uniref:histidine kinase n=1 Tax=Streptantibioticus cattleyicolor (strain ATCC 35852 / DSM 46488 / JCM 4925 / NBRC 14057 / NRRL 8057) TaxID=1003195 RepID=F8JWB5_STREN|nr:MULTISPECIES: histidine kinase [Streptomycetaceae]AEW94483.1 two-component system sensor kinase [Streptantibioticus cattleyicolor NRRL 8057 = DSM 46488]MYS59127.1 two-component sensor histidine kinase [Streptomyces sp. SID5468]CCB74840.1 putative two-component system sensor kinase [Streptantibioticus cattleyicolor NRRL 8057 = DSM 46488]
MTTTGGRRVAVPGGGGGGAARSGPWWWGRRRSFALDATLAAVSAAECAAEGAFFMAGRGLPAVLGVVFGLAVGATLVVRRRWPVAVVLISLAVTPAQMGLVLGVVSLYTLAASDVPRRVVGALVSMTIGGTLLVTFVEMHRDGGRSGYATPSWMGMAFLVLVAIGLTVPPVLLGLYVGARRRLVETLRERADDLERELALLAEKAGERAERARIEERTRIAREMHDVVAHRVSLMVVHAAALRSVAVRDPERAVRSAELLGDLGRQALGELRQMLGVLRTGEPAGPAAPVGPGTVDDGAGQEPSGPQPSLAQLGVLVEESRAAGMAVSLSEEGDRRPLAAPVERTAYRVVQEALTNVHKHAVGAQTLVRVAYRAEEIAVLVENGPPAGEPSAGLPSGGNGLVGMKERVTALGGGFVAGPSRSGGFRVSAVIPARAE